MAKADTRRKMADQAAPGNIGCRLFGGRMGTFNNGTANTFHVVTELQTEFDAVQIIFANTQPRFTDNAIYIRATALADKSDLNASGASWTWIANGSSQRIHTAVAPGANRITYSLSEMIPLKSIPRTDGGTKPLLAIRAYLSAGGALPVLGNGTDSFTNWATRTDGRMWLMRNQAVDAVTTPASFTSTTNVSQSPIVGVRYLSRGKVVNVLAVGDSITDGRGTYLGEGFVMPACEALTTSSVGVEYSNAGWSGQSMALFGERAIDILQSPIRPDVLVMPTGSPNDETTTLTTAGNTVRAGVRARVLDQARSVGTVPVLWTMLPVNSAVNNWGSSDSIRVADNAEALAFASRGVLVANTSAAYSGTTTGGQVQIASGLTSDNIHPNDTGNTALAAVVKPLIARAGGL